MKYVNKISFGDNAIDDNEGAMLNDQRIVIFQRDDGIAVLDFQAKFIFTSHENPQTIGELEDILGSTVVKFIKKIKITVEEE